VRDRIERLKAQVRARAEHAFRMIKRQFGYVKVRTVPDEEHGAAAHAVCAGEYLDGAPSFSLQDSYARSAAGWR